MPAIKTARVALDTNILLYAEGLRVVDTDDRKIFASRALLERLQLEHAEVYVPSQVLGEVHNTLRRKLRLTAEAASVRVVRLMQLYATAATDETVVLAACEIALMHKLQTYDAMILASSASAGCEMLFSEDMQDGFEWGGVTIVNPFG